MFWGCSSITCQPHPNHPAKGRVRGKVWLRITRTWVAYTPPLWWSRVHLQQTRSQATEFTRNTRLNRSVCCQSSGESTTRVLLQLLPKSWSNQNRIHFPTSWNSAVQSIKRFVGKCWYFSILFPGRLLYWCSFITDKNTLKCLTLIKTWHEPTLLSKREQEKVPKESAFWLSLPRHWT